MTGMALCLRAVTGQAAGQAAASASAAFASERLVTAAAVAGDEHLQPRSAASNCTPVGHGEHIPLGPPPPPSPNFPCFRLTFTLAYSCGLSVDQMTRSHQLKDFLLQR